MKDLLKLIEENSNSKSGISIVQLSLKTGESMATINPLVEELKNDGEIRIREGINNDLIFRIC